MKKLYPRDYQLKISEVGDHLEVHIAPLDITVSTAPGKTAHSDALDAAQAAIEQQVMQEAQQYATSHRAAVQ
jgi:hypothetical protein